MSIWPPKQPISVLISEIEATGITLSIAGAKIRCTPAGRMNPLHTEGLRQRRDEAIEYLTEREKKSQPDNQTSEPPATPREDRPSTPTVWLIYEGTDGLDHAITKDDYDEARNFLWGPDDMVPNPPLKNGGRKRWVAIPAGEYPTCWHAPFYLPDGTMWQPSRLNEEPKQAVA